MIEIDNFNRQLIYKNTVTAEDGTALHVSFVLEPHDIEIIHQWRQAECDRVDVDENISEYLTEEELQRYNSLPEKEQLNFITKAAEMKRHYMNSDNIAWREATEMAIKDMRDRLL